MKKSANHLTVRNIKQKINTANKFSLRPINEDLVKGIVKNLSTNKATSGDIPVKLLKKLSSFFRI